MIYSDFTKIGSLLAKEYKITTIEADDWGSSIEKKEVYFCADDVADLPDTQTMAFLLHEIAHIHYTTKWTPEKEDKELETLTMETLEDMAVEHLISKDYTNAKDILTETMKEVHSKMKEALPKLQITKYEKALHFAEIEAKNPGNQIKEKYEIAGKKIANYITTEESNLLNRSKTKELKPHAKEIIKILKEELGEPTEQEKREIQQRLQGGKMITGGNKGVATGIKKNLLMGGEGKDASKERPPLICNQIHSITDQAHQVGRKLESILKSNNAAVYQGKYRSGKLPSKRLTRIKTANDRKPFTKKIEKTNKSYAFAINVDISGSMFLNSIINNALSSCYMTAKALKIAKIPRKISLFATESETIGKKDLQHLLWEDVANPHRRVGGGTDTHAAIIESTKQLDAMKGDRKVMIIITDGDDNDDASIKRAHDKAKKKGIECIGITICHCNRKNMSLERVFGAKNNINIPAEHPDEIGQAFCKILKDKIKKHKNV